MTYFVYQYCDGLVQGCSNSSALEVELLPSSTIDGLYRIVQFGMWGLRYSSLMCFISMMRRSNPIWCSVWITGNCGSWNGVLPEGTKPLHDAILNLHKFGNQEHISMKCYSESSFKDMLLKMTVKMHYFGSRESETFLIHQVQLLSAQWLPFYLGIHTLSKLIISVYPGLYAQCLTCAKFRQ